MSSEILRCSVYHKCALNTCDMTLTKLTATWITGVTFTVAFNMRSTSKGSTFVFPYFSRLFFFNILSAGIEVSVNQSASTFSLKAKRGSVCYKLLFAGHEFVSTGCGTNLYHLSPAIFTVTSLETLCRPHHYVYPYVVSSNCSHICSFQNLYRITFGTQCFISKSNHPFLGLSLSLSFGSHRNVSLSLVKRAPCFQSYCPCIILLHHILDVRKSVPHHTIQIIQPTRCNSFTSLLLDVYVWLNMFRASLRPSSGA
jgi:hypothetical protein